MNPGPGFFTAWSCGQGGRAPDGQLGQPRVAQWIALCVGGVIAVGRDGEVMPGGVGLGPRPGRRRRVGVGLAAQDQPQRRLVHRRRRQDDLRHLGRVAERGGTAEVVVHPAIAPTVAW